MQHPWMMEFHGDYHRDQLLAEAATDRLAAEARRRKAAQPRGSANTQLYCARQPHQALADAREMLPTLVSKANARARMRAIVAPILAVFAVKGSA